MKLLRLTLALGALAALSPQLPAAPGGSVLVVDDDGSAPFSTLNAAVSAAQDGDLILMRDGSYTGVTLDGRSLAICADRGAVVRITSHVRVRNVAAGQTLLLQGLDMAGWSSALRIEHCDGEVWIDDCRLDGQNLIIGATAHAAVVYQSGSVLFSGSTLRVPQYGDDSDGLHVTASSVTLYDTQVSGGEGAFKGIVSGIPDVGGAGVEVFGSRLEIIGSAILGGEGRSGTLTTNPATCPGAPGGPGVETMPYAWGSSEIVVVDSIVLGGEGGLGGTSCGSGPSGPAFQMNEGTLTQIAGQVPSFYAESPVRSGEKASMSFSGQPGEAAKLLTNDALAPKFKGWLKGRLVLSRYKLKREQIATLPASGTVAVLRTTTLSAGAEFEVKYLQSVHAFGPAGLVLGTPRAQVVLDPSY